MKKKLLSGIFAAAMLCHMLPAQAVNKIEPAPVLQPELVLPTGDMRHIEPKRVISGEEPDRAAQFRTATESEVPGFYGYGTDYGREYLVQNKRDEYVKCYDDLLEQCEAFVGNYSDVQGTTVQYNDNTYQQVYYLPWIEGKDYTYDLNDIQLEEVFLVLTNDHPEFYWINSFDYSYYEETGPYILSLILIDEYAEGSVRQELDTQIQKNFEAYVSAAEKYKAQGEYMTAKKVHDYIANAVEYAYDYFEIDGVKYKSPSEAEYAHNIISVLDDDETTMPVCEGYAEAYQLILNALGIDNVYVTGWGNGDSGREPHAWNMVKLDDGEYYWVDVTWDDQPDGVIYKNFARGNNGFEKHISGNPDESGYDFLYALPDVPDTDFELMPFVNKNLINGMDVVASGTCGDNMRWAIYENGALYISGEGNMPRFDFDYNEQGSSAPWCLSGSEINYVIVDEGVTSISSFAFWKCSGITHVYISDGVKKIGNYTFGNGVSTKSVRIPESVTEIDTDAFWNCPSLTEIYYGGTEAQWAAIDNKADIPGSATVHFKYAYTIEDINIENETAEIELAKNIAAVDTALVILAAYDNDVFSFILTHNTEEGTVTFNDERIDDTKTYKVFVWDSLDGLIPLAVMK